MNREQLRNEFKRLKKMSLSEFKREMDTLHARSYDLAKKHDYEAMSIVLQPHQRKAVVEKAIEIREKWDGIYEVTTEVTEGVKVGV